MDSQKKAEEEREEETSLSYISRSDNSDSDIYMEFEEMAKKMPKKHKPVVIDEKTDEKLEIYAEDGTLKVRKLE